MLRAFLITCVPITEAKSFLAQQKRCSKLLHILLCRRKEQCWLASLVGQISMPPDTHVQPQQHLQQGEIPHVQAGGPEADLVTNVSDILNVPHATRCCIDWLV